MALICCLQSLPAPQRLAICFPSGNPAYCLLPQASTHSRHTREIECTHKALGKSLEQSRLPRRQRCSSAASDSVATRSSGSSMEAVGVVIVDHGSKRTEANEMLEEFASMYRWVFCLLFT